MGGWVVEKIKEKNAVGMSYCGLCWVDEWVGGWVDSERDMFVCFIYLHPFAHGGVGEECCGKVGGWVYRYRER